MQHKIIEYLSKIEKEQKVKILLACETGSRAWGFPSPDSDYDIRIIYVHKKDWYLSLSEKKDSIDLMFENNDIDITGWDLRKSLRLLQKSNAPLLERIQSPIIYKSEADFITTLNEIAPKHYSRIATIHHYLSMAKKFLEEVKEKENYKLKKLFYALRSATACKWIIENEDILPIKFVKMIDGLNIENNIVLRIHELIKLKETINESYLHKGEKEIINFIETCIQTATEKKHSLPTSKGTGEELNSFFIKTINQYDY